MRVLVAGASGLIGSALVPLLHDAGHEVRRLVRGEAREAGEYHWDPPGGWLDAEAFRAVDAVINLCGAPLAAGRWSGARKQMISDSRLEPTEVLADTMSHRRIPLLINASAVGVYGDAGAHVLDESAQHGQGFLPELCTTWERATRPAARAGARVVCLRTGLVLSGHGGLLRLLKPIFLAGLGGKLGDGRQYMPWISITDEVSAIRFALEHDHLSGPLNVCAPRPVTNSEFTASFAHALRRPAPWRVPRMPLRLVLGQAADEMALASQRAVPAALRHAGFAFSHTSLPAALADVLGTTT